MKRIWKNFMIAALLPALLVGGTFVYSPRGASAEGAFAATLPPADAAPFSVFNPNHLYLDNGTASISASAGSVTVSANTTAVVNADSIGVTIYVQKWTGTAWETVGSGNTMGGNNSTSYSVNFPKSVTSGYYYRARTIHWVIENGTYEEGERISSTVLVP